MSFDKEARNLLARTVAACRRQLVEDVTDQLSGVFGLHPDGTVLPLERLTHLSPDQTAAARHLRDLLDHYVAGAAGGEAERRKAAFDRMTLEIAFTALNRLAALRLCEERGLVVECVRKGTASDGFQMFERISGGALGGRFETYRVFLECMFDELAVDLGVLFDRNTPQSAIFPSERCIEDVLAELNKADLAHLWTEDETIGWIYQYFNPPEERRAMRDASQAPRNSRELAVRNQFFTPRYVVEFLTDNTLGRIWYEMRKGDTALRDECRLLVRRPHEIFLPPGENAPTSEGGGSEPSDGELLKQPVYIQHRSKKDPRDLRVLDPACGSGHFLLYAFDLLERIYEEAWADAGCPASDVTGHSLRDEFETLEDLRKAVPKLIIEHNLHGIDIDPRAVQIAALALWLRAQKTWKTLGIKPVNRLRIARSNIVAAEPMPGEIDMLREFTASLKPRVLGQLVEVVFEKMKLAGEAGSLLNAQEEIRDAVAEARKQWMGGPKLEQAELFPDLVRLKPEQQQLRFDLAGVTDEQFWQQAEDRILGALQDHAERAENGQKALRRLFAKDAARGFAFIDLCRRRYDVVLMNPPFGNPCASSRNYIERAYERCKEDVDACFVSRALDLLNPPGLVGVIANRTEFFKATLAAWRKHELLGRAGIDCAADLGYGVLDSALVEAASYILRAPARSHQASVFFSLLKEVDKQFGLSVRVQACREGPHALDGTHIRKPVAFSELPLNRIAYWASFEIRRAFKAYKAFNGNWGAARQGLATADDFRFVRLAWECPPRNMASSREATLISGDSAANRWVYFSKGGEYSPYFQDFHLAIDWANDGRCLKAFSGSVIRNPAFYFRPALTYTERTASGFSPRVASPGCVFGHVGPLLAPNDDNDLLPLLGVFMSRVVAYFIELMVESADASTSGSAARHYYQNIVGAVPIPEMTDGTKDLLGQLVDSTWRAKQELDALCETSRFYQGPFVVNGHHRSLVAAATALTSAKDSTYLKILRWTWEIEQSVRQSYGLREQAVKEIDEEFGVHPNTLPSADVDEAAVRAALGTPVEQLIDDAVSNGSGSRAITKKVYFADRQLELLAARFNVHPVTIAGLRVEMALVSPSDLKETALDVLSFALGCAVGRWDVRLAERSGLSSRLPGPMDPIPLCPPASLVGPDGLPAEPSHIVSEEWLRARPDANTLPPEGSVKNPTIADSEYPIRINWDGILVDDPGINGALPHADDIVRRVRDVLDLIWNEKAPEIEQEACEILGVPELREYFRKPSGFFQDHLKRYSKSRRKAPLYWPLSTASGSYTIWLYYHRITDQTLYKAVNQHVEPKIEEIDRAIARMEEQLKSASGCGTGRLANQLSEARAFGAELREFRQELLRIAGLPYKPNLNDGVIINAAPFHKLFRLRSWAKDTEECWNRLAKGDYDWAHLAYTIWPERVREACKRDRSVAIAHGLEELYEAPAPRAKKKASARSKRKASVAEK